VDKISGIQIFGLPEQPIEGLRLENIRIIYNGGGTKENAAVNPPELGTGYPEPRGTMPTYGLFARHVKGLELANITFGYDTQDLRPAIGAVDVDGLEIENLKAEVADGVTPARWESVKNLTIRNSPVLQSQGTEAGKQ
jgi:hypothetical protein